MMNVETELTSGSNTRERTESSCTVKVLLVIMIRNKNIRGELERCLLDILDVVCSYPFHFMRKVIERLPLSARSERSEGCITIGDFQRPMSAECMTQTTTRNGPKEGSKDWGWNVTRPIVGWVLHIKTTDPV